MIRLSCSSVSLSIRLKKRDSVGCDARAALSNIAVMTGSFVSSSAQSSSKQALIIWQITCIRLASSLWIRNHAVSLVLNMRLMSFTAPILNRNSLNRRSPASEDKSPPSKFIFKYLLLSKTMSFKLYIGTSSLF